MKPFALSLLVFGLVGGGVTAAGQTAGIIDTRAGQTSSPSVHIIGGTGSGDLKGLPSLQLELSVLDVRPELGKPFEYQFVVTNKSETSILIPQSPRWSDVVTTNRREQRYEQVAVSFAVVTSEGNTLPFDGQFFLYGSEDKPETMLSLAPGEAVRIVGTATFRPAIAPGTPFASGKLLGYLAVNSTRLRPTKVGASLGYRDDERHLYWAQSTQPVEIEFSGAE